MKKIITAVLIIAMSAFLALPAFANDETTSPANDDSKTVTNAEGETTNGTLVSSDGMTEIYDYEGLLKMKDDPSGSYKLMADVDMKGKEWIPFDFYGTFDGDGHAVLNLEITTISEVCHTTKDGNMLKYDTYFAGFFGACDKATVKNLNLLGLKVTIDTNTTNVFIGGIAGFMEETTISGCNVEGELSLSTNSACFGVGGFLGFGNGVIENSTANVTLMCVDKDVVNKDEQFLGGAYAAGYTDLIGDVVYVQGYVTEHGYSHNGGLIGMYILYYEAIEYAGTISNNYVEGQITFYEDNDDPRAYCEPYVGEVMNWTFEYDGNWDSFTSNNVTEEYREEGFVTVLKPHYCENPTYNDSDVAATCTSYGYTEHTCGTCGAYTYKSDYTALAHNVSEWSTLKAATAAENGVEQGVCADCQATVFRSVSLNEPETAEMTTASGEVPQNETAQETAAAQETKEGGISTVGAIAIIVGIIVVAAAAIILVLKYREKQRRKRRRARQRAEMQRRSGMNNHASKERETYDNRNNDNRQ